MNTIAQEHIRSLLHDAGVLFREFSHAACRTSEESMRVRADAGFPGTIGAKSLLVKLYFHDGKECFAAIVVPGTHTLDKHALFHAIPEVKKMRFATPEELLDIAGVVPGCMPPFGPQVFPRIEMLIVSSALRAFPILGFNIASLTQSVVLSSEDYFSVVKPNVETMCSVEKDAQ